ncbi:myosin-8 [Phtheirospermum japonicum]|uniref:Myosin-8 n=1 Tax=Phtheirospermum japonicum TaxID=374723 RepID=A0A830CLB2_9LAMI|nr:myosin-8 [Phtheirospermum japonicum]
MMLAVEESERAEFKAASGYISYGSVLAMEPTMAEDPVIRTGSSPGRQLQHQCEVYFCPTTTHCKQCKAVRYCLLARGECCTFSNAEYMISGLDDLEVWCGHAQEFVGASWDELKHVRQVVGFLDPAEDEQQLGRVKDWISSYHVDTIEFNDVLSNFPNISVALNMEQPYSNDEIDDVHRRWAEYLLENVFLKGVIENVYYRTSLGKTFWKIKLEDLRAAENHSIMEDFITLTDCSQIALLKSFLKSNYQANFKPIPYLSTSLAASLSSPEREFMMVTVYEKRILPSLPLPEHSLQVSLNKVRAKTEDRESPSQRYEVEERVGCPFKAICFFAPLADFG